MNTGYDGEMDRSQKHTVVSLGVSLNREVHAVCSRVSECFSNVAAKNSNNMLHLHPFCMKGVVILYAALHETKTK